MSAFNPRFTISHAIATGLTVIERARGFLEAATLSKEWIERMSQRALLREVGSGPTDPNRHYVAVEL